MPDPHFIAPQLTPLHALHRELGARMVPFAGYSMPVSYPAGILAEHRHCRAAAALFDVSHMGQLRLAGADAAVALETLVPADVLSLAPGRQRYTFLTDADGGILDDLMITRLPEDAGLGADASSGGGLLLVVNASCKAGDTAHLIRHIGGRCRIEPLPDRALLALQGPQAAAVLARLSPAVAGLAFMSGAAATLAGADCFVSRCGYTGEDGFEISLPAAQAESLARVLLAQPGVAPAGLGARDTLRLEAGLCLYGHDIDVDTTPVEAGLAWAIQKARRPGGARAGGYPGAAVIEGQLAGGAATVRCGLVGSERVPVREGTALSDDDGHALGEVTSGTLAPTVDRPIAMAYLPSTHAAVGRTVYAQVRGRRLPMTVTGMPFAPHRYHRG